MFPKTKKEWEEWKEDAREREAAFRRGFRHGFNMAIEGVRAGKTLRDLCNHFNFLSGNCAGETGEGWFWRGWKSDNEHAPWFKESYQDEEYD